MQAEFERMLSNKILTRRLITSCLALVCLSCFILFYTLWENSKTVTVHGSGFSMLSWTEVRYEDSYIPFIVIGCIGVVLAIVTLLVDLSLCRHKTIRKEQHCITLYRGMLRSIVFIDGEEKGRTALFTRNPVVEVRLPNQVRSTVSFSRSIRYIAHVSFSDDTASREV